MAAEAAPVPSGRDALGGARSAGTRRRPGRALRRARSAGGIRPPCSSPRCSPGFALLAGLSLLLGLLVTDVLVHVGGIGRTDESASSRS